MHTHRLHGPIVVVLSPLTCPRHTIFNVINECTRLKINNWRAATDQFCSAIADNNSGGAHMDEEVMLATNEVNSCDLYQVQEMMFIVNELESLFACHWQIESKFRTNF